MTDTDAPVLDDAALKAEVIGKINDLPVLLFMKGTPDQPYCGFSARTVEALDSIGASFSDPRIRHVVSDHSEWPTMPQLFVDGTLVGGCDIVTEMAGTGELAELIQTAGR